MPTTSGSRVSQSVGWSAVLLSTALASFWAFWGIIENFHEGWYFASLWKNLGLMLLQYLSPMLIFLALGVVSVQWHRVGSLLHVGLALWALWFFGLTQVNLTVIAGPLLAMAAAYWFGNAKPRNWALAVLLGVPLITFVACGAEPLWRILIVGRTNDGNFGARIVQGNGVTLVWAPQGPGWPSEGISWEEALRRCRYLNEDGLTLATQPQDIWRLPSVDEVVRSMQRRGKNCGGQWDGETDFPQYRVMPDKETPLWNVHSNVIYWWTADELDSERAYRICYNGRIRATQKSWAPGYLAFRAVKNPPPNDAMNEQDGLEL